MLRLMIVDDEQIIRESISQMIDFKSIGYHLIAVAKNGMEAYDIICDEYPDVVITDIRMPILNGLDLIERSIKTDSNITFILLSGYSEFEYAKQAMKYGVRYYLLKPTDKQELIEILKSIRQERTQEESLRQMNQIKFLQDLHFPLEQCFIMESLEHLDDFPFIYKKYQSLLSFSENCLFACICSFVEKSYLKNFMIDLNRILSSYDTIMQFPVIYVKNSVVMVFPATTLVFQEKIRQAFSSLKYPNQSVSFETSFLHKPSTQALFQDVLIKISRFEEIIIIDEEMNFHKIHNNIASPWQINRICDSILNATNPTHITEVLDSIFTCNPPLDTARNLALGIFLRLSSKNKQPSLDISCDFFRRLYSCSNISDIQELMRVVILQRNLKLEALKSNTNISLLKAYTNQHLSSENLSLKWLAENYLFVSVGYLSKLFIKEEGMRFSDYLNKQRMEEAIRLMVYYHNDNIKNIACQVGFGNNPQYFSQVFKRYTSCTPSEYIEKLKLDSENP